MLHETRCVADHGHRGLEHQGLAAHAAQLGRGARVVARLAERFAGKIGHLVGADHHRFGKTGGNGMGLFQCQALGEGARRFALQRAFVDFGRMHVEGQAQAGEQFAAVARGRGEDHGALHGARLCVSRTKPAGAHHAGEAAGALDWRG